MHRRRFGIALVCASSFYAHDSRAQPLLVRQTEGAVHGFLTLSSLDGAVLANGDLEQSAHGSRVTSRLIFRFKDGSRQEETTVFSQTSHFRLIGYRLVQKGPAFKRQMDFTLNGSTGEATARYSDGDGKEKVESVRPELPPDVANGIVPVLLRNLAPGASLTASMVVPAPKPQLVKLAISPEGEDWFLTGEERRKATRYVLKVEIGGVKGAIAPLVGKQPPDTRIWIMGGAAPAFLRSDGPSCDGCAVWRTQLAAPVWPNEAQGSPRRTK